MLLLTFGEFFDVLKVGGFDFFDMYKYVMDRIWEFWTAPYIVPIREFLWGFLVHVKWLIPFLLLGLYLIVTFAGKRIFPVLRFLFYFVLGFALGSYLLSPLVWRLIPQIPAWVVGLAIGVVSAVLSKILYVLTLVAIPGYSVYMVCYTGTLIPAVTSLSKGNMVVSIIVAVIIVLIILALHKYVEMLGTALLGGWGIAYVIKYWYDYTAFESFVGRAWLPLLIVTSVIGIVGFAVQFKTRKRF